MKKPVTKADLRADLELATEAFLREGGEVQNVPRGASGTGDENSPPPWFTRRLFVEPRASRTLVPEVVAAIEERRQARLKRTPKPKRGRLPKPRRKTIYDDFGEPLRRVWIED